jgi:C4-dicarboxylate transporter
VPAGESVAAMMSFELPTRSAFRLMGGHAVLERPALLALTGSAAHAAERTAAPLSCWLVGIAGIAPAEARVAVERLAARLQLPTN